MINNKQQKLTHRNNFWQLFPPGFFRSNAVKRKSESCQLSPHAEKRWKVRKNHHMLLNKCDNTYGMRPNSCNSFASFVCFLDEQGIFWSVLDIFGLKTSSYQNSFRLSPLTVPLGPRERYPAVSCFARKESGNCIEDWRI